MRAAMEAGIKIPKLCATDMLDAFGSCRLCLVEIEGRAGTPASCTTPVAEGIVVHTKTERLERIRKGVMELYVSDHPLDSLDRAKYADCDLLGHRGGGRACRRCATAMTAPATAIRASTTPIRISPSIPPSASSARAACAPARRCKARSR